MVQQSAVHGRPPAFSLVHIGVPFPTEVGVANTAEQEMSCNFGLPLVYGHDTKPRL
jgi:hypothetical protein